MESRKWNASNLAKKIGVSHVAIGNLTRGAIPGSEHLYKIANIFGVPMEWLLTGKGPQFETDVLKEEAVKPRNWGGPYYGTSKSVPVVSWASAGNPHAWEDMGPGAPHISTDCKDPNCYSVEVEGNSMEPIYQEGDILVIAPNLQVIQNDLVVFKTIDDEPYFKKFLGERKGIWRFASLNPNYPVMEFRKEELRKMHPVHSVIRPLKEKFF